MIVLRLKPIADIRSMVERHARVLVVGCNTCAAVSLAGGETEVETLVETLRLGASRSACQTEYTGAMIQRQCEPEFVDKLEAGGYDAVLSLGCGAGVAFLANTESVPVYPALDTLFIGAAKGHASWQAECSACGSCVLGETAGICPTTRCAKGIMNGPCGGVKDGRCELGDRDCAWVQIYDRLDEQGRGDDFDGLGSTKDNSVNSMTCEWDMNADSGGSK
ncbi:MAG: hypothetical protein HGB10_05885 [Coriobacteriia bacterium]|nr:hypothetical protein [Coriobacteriia bacterium]